MILKKSLLCMVFCKIYGVCFQNKNSLKESETRYGHKLLCRPRYIPNQVKSNNDKVSEIIMNSNSNQQESEYFNGVGHDDICSDTELLSDCIACFMNCFVVRKLDPDLPDPGWGFLIEFLPNKLKRPVPAVNEQQSPVPKTNNPETPDLTLFDN